MRIISKFHDYYDCAMAQGIDTSLIYKRDREFVVVSEQDIGCSPFGAEVFEACSSWRDPQLVVLSFCGRAYACFIPRQTSYYWSEIDEVDVSAFSHVLTAEGLDQRAVGLCDRSRSYPVVGHSQPTGDPFFPDVNDLRRYITGEDRCYSSGAIIRKDLDVVVKPVTGKSVNPQLHHALGCPVLLILYLGYYRDSGPKRFAILKNPCLKDLGFIREMDPYTAHQEIAMFLGGVMAKTDDAPLRVGSDEVIARQKGFDEWSFRTMAPGQKKLNRKANRERKRGG